jgi:hypothetical protein
MWSQAVLINISPKSGVVYVTAKQDTTLHNFATFYLGWLPEQLVYPTSIAILDNATFRIIASLKRLWNTSLTHTPPKKHRHHTHLNSPPLYTTNGTQAPHNLGGAVRQLRCFSKCRCRNSVHVAPTNNPPNTHTLTHAGDLMQTHALSQTHTHTRARAHTVWKPSLDVSTSSRSKSIRLRYTKQFESNTV